MPERADTPEVIGLIMFAPLLYSMLISGSTELLRLRRRHAPIKTNNPKQRTKQMKQVNGRGVAGLIIFSDVAPGEYNLAGIETTREVYNQGTWHETYNIPGESVTNYIFSVKAAEPKYLGVVTVEETQKL